MRKKTGKKHFGKAIGSKESQLILRFTGDFANSREDEISSFMGMIGRCVKLVIPSEPSDTIVENYQWRPIKDARYGWRGDVAFRCKDKAQAIMIYSSIEGRSIDGSGGSKITVEVIPHASIVIEARNAPTA